MRLPPLLADFHSGACKPICEKFLTLPIALTGFYTLSAKELRIEELFA